MNAEAVHVLVVDDEPPIVQLVSGYLEREGWRVTTAGDGRSAIELARASLPDVVVLDLMLPGIDGIEVCRTLRTFSDAYILMLTARSEEVDKLIGLAVGADDYLTKPFSPRELVARIKALLRRAHAATPSAAAPSAATVAPARAATAPAGLVLDVARHEVRVDGVPVELTPIEFGILTTLARDPGVVVSRQGLLDAVWEPEFYADDHIVDVHVANLRRKVGDDAGRPRFVETVRGVGYRLVTGD